MKKRRYFGLDFSSKYEVADRVLYVREAFGNIQADIPLLGTTAKRERKGLLGFFLDFGDVIVLKDGVELHRCTKLSGCSHFQSYLEHEANRKDQLSPSRVAQKREVQRAIPQGIEFSLTVLAIPGLEDTLYWMLKESGSTKEPTALVSSYDWVEFGQPIARYEIKRSRHSPHVEVEILSPAAGIVLVSGFGRPEPVYGGEFAILLPTGFAQLSVANVYEPLLHAIEANRDFLLSMYKDGNPRAIREQSFQDAFSAQKRAEYRYIALHNRYDMYLREMQQQKPATFQRLGENVTTPILASDA